MAKVRAKKETQTYKYETSDVEAAYKIFYNPDLKKREAIKEKLKENDGFCPSRGDHTPANRCMCEQFQNRDSEGWCKCHLYYKEARTEKQAAEYKNAEIKVDEKKEKELEKQFIAEEKKMQKEEEERAVDV